MRAGSGRATCRCWRAAGRMVKQMAGHRRRAKTDYSGGDRIRPATRRRRVRGGARARTTSAQRLSMRERPHHQALADVRHSGAGETPTPPPISSAHRQDACATSPRREASASRGFSPVCVAQAVAQASSLCELSNHPASRGRTAEKMPAHATPNRKSPNHQQKCD